MVAATEMRNPVRRNHRKTHLDLGQLGVKIPTYPGSLAQAAVLKTLRSVPEALFKDLSPSLPLLPRTGEKLVSQRSGRGCGEQMP